MALIDTDAVRSGASDLDMAANGLSFQRGGMFLMAQATHWQAPAAERIAGDLSVSDGRARTAVVDLHAVADHLRRLAEAVDTLRGQMRVEHDRQVTHTTAALRGLTPEQTDERRDLNVRLSTLPGPEDPYWSGQVHGPAVRLPTLPVVPPTSLVPLGPHVGVSVDVAAVRQLAETVGGLSQEVSRARERCGPAAALPFWQLDAFGLPGSRTGTLVADVTGATSDLARSGLGFDMQARQAAVLAGIIERADTAHLPRGVLLEDPRLSQAVDLAATLTTGADAKQMWDEVGDVSPDDLAWLMTVVPELETSLGAMEDEEGEVFSKTDYLWFTTALWDLPGQSADQTQGLADQAGRDAKAIKPIKGSTLAQRQAYRAAIREMRSARGTAATVSSVSAKVPGTSVLKLLNTPLSATKPVLRDIPVLSVVLTGVGIYEDVQGGKSVTHAVVKNVTSTAAGLGATALTTSLIAGTALAGTAVAPIVIAVGVGVIVSWGTGKLIDAYGDDIADFTVSAAKDVWHAGGVAVDGVADAGQAVGGAAEDAWNWAFG